MKKMLIIAMCLLACGCGNKINPSQSEYNQIIEELNTKAIVENDLPFSIKVEIYDLDKEYMYNIIIEKPIGEIKDIKLLAMHDIKTEDVFPSIGIFDDEVNLTKTNKGIVLVGYILKEKYDNINFKVYLEYEYKDTKYKKYVLIPTKNDK